MTPPISFTDEQLKMLYHAYARHPADWLLRSRRKRPGRRAAEQSDELPPSLAYLKTGC
jgi:hypothetical protein